MYRVQHTNTLCSHVHLFKIGCLPLAVAYPNITPVFLSLLPFSFFQFSSVPFFVPLFALCDIVKLCPLLFSKCSFFFYLCDPLCLFMVRWEVAVAFFSCPISSRATSINPCLSDQSPLHPLFVW